jgi:putative transposase
VADARKVGVTPAQLKWAALLRKPDKAKRAKRGKRAKRLGRPPRGARSSERHKVRPELVARYPLHIIMRAASGLGTLRAPRVLSAIREAMRVTFKLEDQFRIIEFSIQRTHVHLIVEANDRFALAKGMQVFGISAAKHINATLRDANGDRRRGTVFADRYHAVPLKTPTQVRNTICYVLNNWRHHGEQTQKLKYEWPIDPYSTAPLFMGWKELGDQRFKPPPNFKLPPRLLPSTWLLAAGWRKVGLISMFHVPGGIE